MWIESFDGIDLKSKVVIAKAAKSPADTGSHRHDALCAAEAAIRSVEGQATAQGVLLQTRPARAKG